MDCCLWIECAPSGALSARRNLGLEFPEKRQVPRFNAVAQRAIYRYVGDALLLALAFAAPTATPEQFSTRASHSTVARRESSPWGCQDRPAGRRLFLVPRPKNSSLLPRSPAMGHRR